MSYSKQKMLAVHDKQIFLVVEETTLSGIQYLNIVVESRQLFFCQLLYDCQPLPCTPNSNIIAHAVDDAAKSN